jgi:hypothetical protein
MAIESKLINATPRNGSMYYYTGSVPTFNVPKDTGSGSSSGGNDINPILYEDEDVSLFPTVGDSSQLYVDTTAKTVYYWDEVSSTYKLITGTVQKLIAGSNVTISPESGVGEVTISSTGDVQKIVAGSNVTISPETGVGEVTISSTGDVQKIIAGNNITVSPETGVGEVTVNSTATVISLPPVGFQYVQYASAASNDYDVAFPLEKRPESLWPGTFWSKLWEDELVFFRTGGSSATLPGRTDGKQDQASQLTSHTHTISSHTHSIPSHTHSFGYNTPGAAPVILNPGAVVLYVFSGVDDARSGTTNSGGSGTSGSGGSGNTGSASNSTETRPVNRLMIIWERNS